MSWGWCQADNLDWKSFLEGSGYYVYMCSWVCWPSGLLLKLCGFTPCPRARHPVPKKSQGRSAHITLLSGLHPFWEFWLPSLCFPWGLRNTLKNTWWWRAWWFLLVLPEDPSFLSVINWHSSNVILGSQYSNSSSHIKTSCQDYHIISIAAAENIKESWFKIKQKALFLISKAKYCSSSSSSFPICKLLCTTVKWD